MRASARSSRVFSVDRTVLVRPGSVLALAAAAAAAVALALLELAHQLDPLGKLAQIGARGVARALARCAAPIGIEGLLGFDGQARVAEHLEHRALVAFGRIAPAHRGVAAVVVHDGTDPATLGLRKLRTILFDRLAHRIMVLTALQDLIPRVQRNRAPCADSATSVTECRRCSHRPSEHLPGAQQADHGFTVAYGAAECPVTGLRERQP